MSSRSSARPAVDVKPYVGALLRPVWQWVRDQMYSGVVAAGYDDLTAAHVGLWRYPGLEGLRPSELADRVEITKQSVNELLAHLEHRGYLQRVAHESDGRARVIRLAPISPKRTYARSLDAGDSTILTALWGCSSAR